MEAIIIKAVVRELRESAVPARVRAVFQTSPRNIILEVRSRETLRLLISADPAGPQVHLLGEKPTASPSPTAFCRLVRKHLDRARLVQIHSPGMERAVHFLFSGGAEDRPDLRLVAELMGRRSNLILVAESSQRIVDSLHHVPGNLSRARIVVPGEPYRPPPASGRIDLGTLGEAEFSAHYLRSEQEGAGLFTRLLGPGPRSWHLVEAAAVREPDFPQDPAGALFRAWEGLRRALEEGKLRPVVYPAKGALLPLPVPGWEGEPHLFFPTMNRAAEHFYRELGERREKESLRRRLLRALEREHRKTRRDLERLREESGEAGRAYELQAAGRGLLSALTLVPRGAASFSLPDPADPAAPPRRVELDPSLSPRRNAERFFRRAKKIRRRAALAAERLPGLTRRAEELEERMRRVPDLALRELRARIEESAGAAGTRRSPRAGRPAGRYPGVREYRSKEGWRLLVGKSGRGNEYLTGKVASPDDLWFHARDCPGAHVVLKSGREAEPPEEVIQAAGEVAAYHSGARSEGLVEVSYLRKKHLRKVRGQAPGRVLAAGSRTVRVRPRVPAGFEEVKG